jgi:hypothetical protein
MSKDYKMSARRRAFVEAANKMFPTTSVFTRQELIKVQDSCGVNWYWIRANRKSLVARGVYRLPDVDGSLDLNSDSVGDVAPKSFFAKTRSESVEHAAVEMSADIISMPKKSVSANVRAIKFDSVVPKANPNYVKFGHYNDLKLIVASKQFYPVFLTGQSGNGKTEMVHQICAELKRGLVRVNFTPLTDESDLLGDKTLLDGTVYFEEGAVIHAMKTGSVLLLDELDYASAQGFTALQSVLEGKPFLNKKTGEIVSPAPGFNIIATANTKGKGSEDGRFVGVQFLNEAFLERFAVTMEQEYASAAIELRIIKKEFESHTGDSCEDFARELTQWSAAIRKTFDDGGCSETMSTRRLIHIVKAYSMFKDCAKSVKLCVNRFDNDTRDSFYDLFTKIHAGEPVDSIQPQDEVAINDDIDSEF